jgi:hypothetical protein
MPLVPFSQRITDGGVTGTNRLAEADRELEPSQNRLVFNSENSIIRRTKR